MKKQIKFSDLKVGSFFGCDEDCFSCSILVKTSDKKAFCVWDSMGQEARGMSINIEPNVLIRETYTGVFTDEQTPSEKRVFKVKTSGGSFGCKDQDVFIGHNKLYRVKF
jgi:hypothetical protein